MAGGAHRPANVRTTIIVPGVFGCVALALLVVDHFVRTNLFALGLATASIFVIVVRLYLAVQDNGRMLAQSRREAATDALTGLGNRRQLKADLAVHLDELDPERPLMLTLFDLDGFKHYNDTFGHLAGDQLLERLGARLTELLAGRGTAYRMGGDEFCALWNLADVGRASATTMEAVAALSEHGEAFSIGCSYGSVLLPNETSDITEALRIADRRMYVRKSSGHASAGRRAPTSCCARSPNATRSSAFTSAAWRNWRVRRRCGSAFPRRRSRRCDRQRSSTTWARSRSRTRS